MSKEQLEALKQKRPRLIRELRAAHDRLLKGDNNVTSILSCLIFLFEMEIEPEEQK
jgi:hypothetical protein